MTFNPFAPPAAEPVEEAAEPVEEGAADLVFAVAPLKFLSAPDNSPYRIRKMGVVWGGSDLVGDTFTRDTDLGGDRSYVGMPVYYDHAQGDVKAQVGRVVGAEETDEGIIFDIELDRAKRYADSLMRLERARALGASTGAPSHLVSRKAGVLERWIISEISLTPEPAEPRTRAAVKNLEDTTMADDTAPAALNAASAADIAALTSQVAAIRTDLDALAAMPAVKSTPRHETTHPEADVMAQGGAYGGGLSALADPTAASAKFRNFKSISRFGAATKPEEYPDDSLGGLVKAVARTASRNVPEAIDAVKALRDVYGTSQEDAATKALTMETGVSGGYTIGQQFLPTLMQIAGMTNDGIYERSMVIPSDGGELVVPALHQSGSYVAGQSQFFGGVSVTWGSNDASSVETQPVFDQIKLKTNAMKALVRIQNSLLMRSAVTIDSVVTTLLANAIAWNRNYALFQGTGAGQPLGIINSPAAIDVAGSAIDYATLSGMLNRTVPSRADNYVWFVHTLKRSAIAALQQSNNTLVTFLPDLRGKPGTQLFGLPVIYTDKLPYDASDVSNSVVLADPSAVITLEYQGIQIAVSNERYFDNDQTGIRIILSLDAQPWLKGPVAIGSDAAATVSTIIKI